MRYGGLTLLTDPNVPHRGQYAYLGHGLVSRRLTEPAVDVGDLPRPDGIVLSHLHGDHWDRRGRRHLDRCVPVLTTPHAARRLRVVHRLPRTAGLRTWQGFTLRHGDVQVRVTALPGRHAGHPLVRGLLPPVMGTMPDGGRTAARRTRPGPPRARRHASSRAPSAPAAGHSQGHARSARSAQMWRARAANRATAARTSEATPQCAATPPPLEPAHSCDAVTPAPSEALSDPALSIRPVVRGITRDCDSRARHRVGRGRGSRCPIAWQRGTNLGLVRRRNRVRCMPRIGIESLCRDVPGHAHHQSHRDKHLHRPAHRHPPVPQPAGPSNPSAQPLCHSARPYRLNRNAYQGDLTPSGNAWVGRPGLSHGSHERASRRTGRDAQPRP